MRQRTNEPGSLTIDTPTSLRARMEKAQKERAIAEAEFDALL